MGFRAVLASLGQVQSRLLADAGVGPRDDHRPVLQPGRGAPGPEQVPETCRNPQRQYDDTQCNLHCVSPYNLNSGYKSALLILIGFH